MMKKNKLYTVTRFNKPLFMPKENLFVDGGNTWQGLADNWQGYDDSLWDDKTTQYMNSKNWLGISKKNNPFSKGNLKGMGKTMGASAIGMGTRMAGQALGSAIGGGLESGVGNVINTIGNVLPDTGNPLWDSMKNIGVGVLGGLANRMLGSKLNQANINTVNKNINKTMESGNAVGNAQTNEDLIANAGNLDMGFDFSNSYIGSDGWFSSKARKKAEELRRKQETARAFAKHALTTGAQNADANIDFNVMSNFAAFGGPLDNNVGAIGYDLMTDYLTTKRKNSDNKNQMTNLFMGTPKTFFDEGGYMTPDEEDAAVERAFTTKAVWNTDLPFGMKADAVMGKDSFNEIYKGVFNSPLFAFGGDLQTHGGDYSVGKVYDVSNEEANRLKAMGYEFEYIN